MKALSFQKNSTNSYNSFKTYESAEFNEPYVAAVFNASFVNEGFKNFTLGKKIATLILYYPFTKLSFHENCSRFQIVHLKPNVDL